MFLRFIATIITILTYKRARYTILQPLRTEVIKRQTDLLIDVMTVFCDESKLLSELDLDRIVALNTYSIMEQYGYVLNESERLREECRKHFVGGVIVKNSNQLEMFEKPDVFGKSEEGKNEKDFRETLYERLKEGIVDIEMIQLTKKYYDTMQKYESLANNAFLPKEIKGLLEQIIRNIHQDISIRLKKVLEDFILKVYAKNQSDGKFSVNFSGVYNEFNEVRCSNGDLILKIREKTREYLLIDKKW